MQPRFRPNGIFAAQWIPTDAAGRLERGKLEALLGFERRAGISGVLALGSTGEFLFFSPDERKAVITAVMECAAPLPVIVNISDVRPRVAIELGRFARHAGAAAVSLMAPMFYPVSQADMLAYFTRVADAVELPVMLYNFPELTGKKIAVETVAAFAERAAMCAIKQSGGEFDYHRELIALARQKHFVVMSGADTRLPEVFALGGAGCIGGLVNLVPELMVRIAQACRDGRRTEVSADAARMIEVGKIVDRLTFPLNVAAGIAARGFEPGEPKAIVSSESRALYDGIVAELRDKFAAWGLMGEGAQ